MAFEGLTEKLAAAFKKLRGKGRLSEADVKEAMREIRLALLEADVSYKVVKQFIAQVTEKAVGADVLEARQYNHVPFQDVTWADSDLRAWMNGDFFTAAFTPSQQGIIPSVLNENADQSIAGTPGGAPTQDRVFALSEQESVVYLSGSANRSDIGAAPASQAAASGPLAVSEDGTADWWLRSPGTYAFAAQYVDTAGTPLPSGANVDVLYGVRPALWIDIAEVGGGQQ